MRMTRRLAVLFSLIGSLLLLLSAVAAPLSSQVALQPQQAEAAAKVQQSPPTVDPQCLVLPETTQESSLPAANDTATLNVVSPADPDAQAREKQLLRQKRFPEPVRDALRNRMEHRSHKAVLEYHRLQATPPPTDLEPGIVYGRVLLPDGSPAVDALIWLFAVDEEGFRDYDQLEIAFTDGEGVFSFGWLAAGDYIMDVEPPEDAYGVIGVEDIAVSLGYPEAWVDVGDVTLGEATKHIRGSVLLDGTTPVANAEVSAFNVKTWQDAYVFTDENGEFDLGVSGGEWEVEVIQQPGVDWIFTDTPAVVRFAEDDSEETVEIALQVKTPDGYLTGRVLDPAGNPLVFSDDPNAEYNYGASLDVWNMANESYTYAFLNLDGTFRVPVTSGVYDVWVWLDETIYPTYSGPVLDLVDVSKGTVELDDIMLLAENSTIQGTVTDQDGNGVGNVFVDVWQEQGAWEYTQTDATGAYTITVTAGDWLVEPSTTEEVAFLFTGMAKELTVADDETQTVDFTLEAVAGTIAGRVVDPDDQRVTDIDAWAYARLADSPEPVSVEPVIEGRFNLRVPAGAMQVGVFLAPGSEYSFLEEATPTPDSTFASLSRAAAAMLEMLPYEQQVTVQPQADSQVKIVLHPNDARIQGNVVDASGNPVSGIEGDIFVSPVGNNTAWQWSRINPGDGSFEIAVAGGDWKLSYDLFTEDYLPYPAEDLLVNVPAEQTVTQNLELVELDGIISGQVVDEDGTPLANTYVWVSDGVYEFYVLTDEQGYFIAYVPLEEEAGSSGLTATLARRGYYSVQTAVKNCKRRYRGGQLVRCLRDAVRQSSRPRVRSQANTAEAEISQEVGVVLVVRDADAYLVGQVFDADSQPVSGAFVYGYSSDNQNANTETDEHGCFQMQVAYDEEAVVDWRLSARFYDSAAYTWWESEEYTLNTSGMEEVTLAAVDEHGVPLTRNRMQAPLVLKENANKIQAPEMHTFEVERGWSYTLPDGTRIQIPANAVPTEETSVQISIKPNVYLPDNGIYRKVGNGYTFTLYEAQSGKKITQKLKTDAVISFRASSSQQLMDMKDDISSTMPVRYVADTWQPEKSYTRNTNDNSINVKTNVTGTWALVEPQAELSVEPLELFLPLVSKVQ